MGKIQGRSEEHTSRERVYLQKQLHLSDIARNGVTLFLKDVIVFAEYGTPDFDPGQPRLQKPCRNTTDFLICAFQKNAEDIPGNPET
jgi:hypothetical protein